MKTPKYVDNRYPRGYVRAAETNLARTFARIRAELKAKAEQEARDKEEAVQKMRPMRRKEAA